MIDGGTEIHFVALLDAEGNTLRTTPLSAPIRIPVGQVANVSIDLRLDVAMKPMAIKRSAETEVS